MKFEKIIIKAFVLVLIVSAFLVAKPNLAALEDYNITTSVAETWAHGTYDYWDLIPVNEKSEFNFGEKIQFFAQSDGILVDHTWTLKIYHEDVFNRETSSTYYPPENGWNYSNFVPFYDNLPVGSFRADFYLNSGNGDEFINSKNFSVIGSGQENTLYTFHHAVTALSWSHGLGDEYWNLSPIGINNTFPSGEDVSLMTQVRNIYVDHRYKVELRKDGDLMWDYSSEWLDVGDVWSYGNFYPTFYNARVGSFDFKVYIDVGNGFIELATVPFTVSGDIENYSYRGTYLSEGWEHGAEDEYWNLKPIGEKYIFNIGDDVQVLSQLMNLYSDHQWKAELYRGDTFLWDYTTAWQDVGAGWTYGNFYPSYRNAQPGEYTFHIYIKTGDAFTLLDSKDFIVEGSPDEVVFDHATLASGWEHGVGDDYWNLTPVNSGTTFSTGDNVYLMTQIRNILVDHRYKVEFYSEGQLAWSYETELLEVGSGWSYSNFYPTYYNAQAGNYEFWYYLDTGNGYSLGDKKAFIVE